jgi:hypothetical protein
VQTLRAVQFSDRCVSRWGWTRAIIPELAKPEFHEKAWNGHSGAKVKDLPVFAIPAKWAGHRDATGNQDSRPFGEADDAVIRKWINRLGNHLKRIGQILLGQFGPR